MAEGTRAIHTLDCATKLRIHYLLPAPLPDAFRTSFPGAKVTVDAFSRLVAGAKDHFSVSRPGLFRASGVVGEARLVVTYGKPTGENPVEAVAEVESALVALGLGPVVPVRGSRTRLHPSEGHLLP